MSSIRSFIPLQKLGQGTYSSVYKVRRIDDNQVYALKKVKLSSLTNKEKENSLNQVRILASIQSPYIIAYKEAFFDESLNVLCIVMEYADSGDLQNYIKTAIKQSNLISQYQIWLAAQHILKALCTLHEKGILHRDLKCANVFKHNGIYKLGDLNVSKVNHDKNKFCYTQTGTPYYASPQVWRDEPYDLKSDIWSFGCVIYEMCALKPPFNGQDMQQLFKSVQRAKFPKWTGHYSSQLWQFVNLCLQKQPRNRPNANQLLNVIKKHHSVSNGIKIIDKKQDGLLKTIKVPTDLKKLNDALPQSKYGNQSLLIGKSSNKNKNDSFLMMQKLVQRQNLAKNTRSPPLSLMQQQPSSIVYDSQKKQQDFIVQKPLLNKQRYSDLNIIPGKNKSLVHLPYSSKNQQRFQNNSKSPPASLLNLKDKYLIPESSYKSPRNRNQSSKLLKSPKSQMRLGKKVESSVPGYSERHQQSDRKPSTVSKVQKIRSQLLNEVNCLLKKPSSMPRTQKSIINSSYLIDSSNISKIQNSQLGKYRNAQMEEKIFQKNYSNISTSGKNYRSGEQMPNRMIGAYMLAQKNYQPDGFKPRLIKKNRILSSGLMMKPSWG